MKMFNNKWLEDDQITVYFDGLEMQMYIHGLFSSLKSSLDLFANIIVKSFLPNQTLAFNKGIISNRKVSGGRLINWLNHSAPTTSKASEIAKITQRHTTEWITDAVQIRDDLIHRKDHEKILPMNVSVPNDAKKFSDLPIIEDWKMPGGENLRKYIFNLGKNYRTYFREVIPLIPGVDCSDLTLSESYDALDRDQRNA